MINALRLSSVCLIATLTAGLVSAVPAAAQSEIRPLPEYEAGCADGDGESCFRAAGAYYTGTGVDVDVQRAIEFYSRACDLGQATSCDNLGMMAVNGEGIPKDLAGGARYFARGCDLGHAPSCHHLSNAHRKGEGVDQDMTRFAELARRACELDHAAACRNLGVYYRIGESGDGDLALSLDYYNRACDLGSGIACVDVALAYYNGAGVGQDFGRASELLHPACEQDIESGCANLAVLYQNGEGVEKNVPRALSLYARACRLGGEYACSIIEGTRSGCVDAYGDIATETEFGPDKPLVLSFVARIGGDARQLFEDRTLGMAVSLREYDSGDDSFDPKRLRDSLKPGQAEILIWPGQEPHFIQASAELTDVDSAAAFLEEMCSLAEHGLFVTSVSSFVILSQYTLPTE